MAGGSRGGDMVLGGRHLVGIFALLVVVLGITFTLGYLLGRSRYEGQSAAVAASENEAASAQPKTAPASASGAPASAEAAPPSSWDFYRSGEPAKAAELEPAPKPAAAVPAPAVAAARPVAPAPAKAVAAAPAPRPAVAAVTPRAPMPGSSALIPKGAITLQVAALVREADALALAQELQGKKFPAIVTTPSTDKYYRVQVGPYPDLKAATAARRELEKQGFKPMVRR